ncbi:MAG TPA: peptidylprolyl isomerase [Mycobacteriales bacterium]|nr:peptidylprolyl isomerase [Mycobacteriales bacterium]
MPSNKRQRELARRRAERQAARRAAERARRRKRRTVLGLSIGGVALAVVILLLALSALRGDDDKDAAAKASETPTPTAAPTPTGPCQVTEAAGENTGGKKPGLPPNPSFGKTKTLTGTLALDAGTIEMTLFADKAPCTVNSMRFLASKKYFDNVPCHRQTNTPGLVVLQCGDPSGTGGGGPGYTFKDENLPKTAPGAPTAKYPRGTVAMANGGPGTNGSQFFLVIKDSTLPPNYTVWGQITKGLDVLDKLDKIGIAEGKTDGAPKNPVKITTFTIK